MILLVVVSLLTARRDPPRPIQDVDGRIMSPSKRLGTLPLGQALSGKFEAEDRG